MVHKAGDLVRINPEYYAKEKRQLLDIIRQRGPDYVYTVKFANVYELVLVEDDMPWTNSLKYLVPAFEEVEDIDVDLENLL